MFILANYIAQGRTRKVKKLEEGQTEETVELVQERPFQLNPEWRDDYDKLSLFVLKTLLPHNQTVADERKRLAQFKN
jgi:hypothetical protein